MANDEYIVEMRHITKRFPGIVANNDISLGIKKGEIFALLGENGAGKSTLMSMLFGMYEPDEGEIYIRGKREHISSPNHATRLNIGMVHQHFKLVSNYTIAENIILGIEPRRLAGIFPVVDIKGTNEKVAALSRQYGLEVNPAAKIEDVNVSTQQRVEILKMLYREAEILIFDEPTAVLTPQEIDFLLQIIRGLRDQGKTIILITHKLEEIKQVADRCAILNRGKLIDVLDVAATSTQTMANLMVGREVDFTVDKSPARPGGEILKVEHLTVKNADGFPVVKDVSFTIHAGEIFAIAGVSGNGQTEIADAVAGMIPAAEGSITLDGTDITRSSVRARTDLGLSYIPEDRQSVGLVLDFSLADNLALKTYYKPPFSEKGILNHAAFDSYGEKLIQEYDVRSGQGIHTVTRSMSGGNQQKAIIAREVDKDPQLLVAVQPTRGLDVGAIEYIHKQIVAERDKGRAVLLVSLELDEVMNLSDRILVIYEGEIVGEFDPKKTTVEELGLYMAGAKKQGEAKA
ncbi:MAG: ABC transporter ATP-binding protein [Pseudoflavonifractor sp.]|nr:ABC transporter ATP-binding protein [Pseudoflavonifractor sp.]